MTTEMLDQNRASWLEAKRALAIMRFQKTNTKFTDECEISDDTPREPPTENDCE